LNINSETLRNKIGIFLGNFSLILNKTQLNSLIDSLLKNVNLARSIQDKIVNLVVLNNIAKVTGSRHGI